MLRTSVKTSVFRCFHGQKPPLRSSRSKVKPFLKITAASVVVGALAYDGYNEFEICGGLTRFVRSLKVGLTISADYAWSLRGLTEQSENYAEVTSQRQR